MLKNIEIFRVYHGSIKKIFGIQTMSSIQFLSYYIDWVCVDWFCDIGGIEIQDQQDESETSRFKKSTVLDTILDFTTDVKN